MVLLIAACGGAAAPTASSSQQAAAKPSASASVAASAPAAKEKIAIAYTSFTLDQLSAMVAKEQGFFEQNGLDADVVSIGAGSQPNAALMSNQIQSYEGGPEVVAASLAGADLEFIGAVDTAFLFWLYSIPSVTTAADLKGKQIAVTSLTSSTYTAAKIGVRSLKLDPEKDVFYTAVNNPPAIFAAMQNGAAQAGSIGSTNIVQVRKSGYHMLVDIASLGVPYPAGWYAVSKKWANAHEDTVQRMMRSIVQAVPFMLKEPAATQKILAKYSKNEDQEFLTGVYDLVSPHLNKAPYADVRGVKLVLDELSTSNPAAKTADPNAFVDNHWVKSLDDSGYIASLYK